MDAKITKGRLGNYLAYEWLKMICVSALAVFLIVIIFTMTATRVTTGQTFSIYGFSELSAGADFHAINEDFGKKVFSYEILKTEAEAFSTADEYSGQVLAARRSVGDGDVMFISNVVDTENPDMLSQLQGFLIGNNTMILDPVQFIKDSEEYLAGFFGENWKEGALNEAKAEESFRARNTGDKRFQSDAQISAGIASEKARLSKLRDELIVVENALAEGRISYTTVSVPSLDGTTRTDMCRSFHVGNLKGIEKLFNYAVQQDGKTVTSAETLNLMLFNNSRRDGVLQFEAISYLSYLVTNYR